MSEFARPPEAEKFLAYLNECCRVGEDALVANLPPHPVHPILFIVGPPRTGTTMLLQLLAESPWISTPTNLLARFYGAPYLGSLIQRLLTDPALGYRNELDVPIPQAERFRSTIGKTDGLTSPHEFFYFWRQFFPVGLPSQLTGDQWRSADGAGFVRGLAKIETALGTALALKGIILQYNLLQLADLLPGAVFLVTTRDEVANVESLLGARRTAGDENAWFSVQPPGWERLLPLSPLEQVCGQVAWTNDDLAHQCSLLPADRVVRIGYEELCSDTAGVWERIVGVLGEHNYELPNECPRHGITTSFRKSSRDEEIREQLVHIRAFR